MALEERLKQRMLGGAVLVALIVIFVPMLIEEPVDSRDQADHTIPIKPQPQRAPQPQPEVPSKQQKNTASEAPPPTPVVKRSTQPKPIAKPKPTPTPENIKTATADKPRASPSAWMIQVASMTRESNAKRLVEKLRKSELPAQMEAVKLDGKQHYRVKVGPEVDHRLAEKMLAKIKKEFKLTPKLMRYP
jgi:DedD protein